MGLADDVISMHMRIVPSEARSLLGLDRGLYGFFASF